MLQQINKKYSQGNKGVFFLCKFTFYQGYSILRFLHKFKGKRFNPLMVTRSGNTNLMIERYVSFKYCF